MSVSGVGHVHVAAGDCERVRPGPIAQPVNTSSSLLLVVAGETMRRQASDDWWRAAGWATSLAGVGSAAYHGPGGRLGRVVHDLGVAAMAVTCGAAVVAAPVRHPRLRGLAAAVAAVAAGVHATSRTGGPLCDPDSAVQGHAVWHGLIAAAAWLAAKSASGAALSPAGRTRRGSAVRPSRRPRSR